MAFLNYFVVRAEYGELSWTFTVAPGIKLTEEVRSADEIGQAAAAKGFDVSYCSSLYGMSEQHKKEIRSEVARYLLEFKNVRTDPWWKLQVEPLLRIIVPT